MLAKQKVPRIRAQWQSQALHFQKPAPPKLRGLINLANIVPPEFELEDLIEKITTAPQPVAEDDWDDRALADATAAQMIDVFHSVVVKLPTDLRRWVLNDISVPRDKALTMGLKTVRGFEWGWLNGDPFILGPEMAVSLMKAIYRYVEFREICEALRGIARTAETRGSDRRSELFRTKRPLLGGYLQFDEQGKSHLVKSALSALQFKGFITVDEEGIIRTKMPPVIDAISEDDIEATRIRECKVCKRIFWAGRITSQCCSPACSNTFRVRRHRYKTAAEKAKHKHKRYTRDEEKEASCATDRKKD